MYDISLPHCKTYDLVYNETIRYIMKHILDNLKVSSSSVYMLSIWNIITTVIHGYEFKTRSYYWWTWHQNDNNVNPHLYQTKAASSTVS